MLCKFVHVFYTREYSDLYNLNMVVIGQLNMTMALKIQRQGQLTNVDKVYRFESCVHHYGTIWFFNQKKENKETHANLVLLSDSSNREEMNTAKC